MSACAFGFGGHPGRSRKPDSRDHLAKGLADATAGVAFFGFLVWGSVATLAVCGTVLAAAPAWFVPVALIRAEEHKFRGVVKEATERKPEPPSEP